MARAKPSGQMSQCLRGLYNSCHNKTVRATMREEKWSELFWKIADSSGYPAATRNMVLELLSWTLNPTNSSLEKLLTLITASSPEKTCWGAEDLPAASEDVTPDAPPVDPARGRWACTCSPEVSIGIRPAPTECILRGNTRLIR